MKSIASLLFLTLMALLAPRQEQKPGPQFYADVRVWNKRDTVAHMKIFDRYQECGMHGLTDRSRRPYRYANRELHSECS